MTDERNNVIRFSDYQPKPRAHIEQPSSATVMVMPVIRTEQPASSNRQRKPEQPASE